MGTIITKTSENQAKGLLKDATDMKTPWLRTQGTRKQGCKACIHIREYILFPEYSTEDDIASKVSKWKLQQLKEEKLRFLRDDIEKGVAKGVRKYFVFLPSAEAHHTTHPTGGTYGKYTLNWWRKFISWLVKELQLYQKWSMPLIVMSNIIYVKIALLIPMTVPTIWYKESYPLSKIQASVIQNWSGKSPPQDQWMAKVNA